MDCLATAFCGGRGKPHSISHFDRRSLSMPGSALEKGSPLISSARSSGGRTVKLLGGPVQTMLPLNDELFPVRLAGGGSTLHVPHATKKQPLPNHAILITLLEMWKAANCR